MSILTKIITIAVGLVLIWAVVNTMKQKKMSAGQSLLWLLAGVLIIVLGLFPEIVTWAANILGVWWNPAVVLFMAVVLLAFIDFNHAKEISIMRAQITELGEQISVMKRELIEKEILKEEWRED